ncbi:MAG TPA: response regulator, partial [Clostridiales bacterium]|nr:response regulator [Clostridiales bacterium]
MKILIICNSTVEISAISAILSEYDILTAGDGLEAMQMLGKNPDIELVIFDLQMQNTDYLQVFDNFQSQKQYQNLKIIALSDSDAAEDEINCLKLGVDDYIRKSTQMQSLKYRVKLQSEILQRQKEMERKENNLKTIMESVFQQAPIGITISHNS